MRQNNIDWTNAIDKEAIIRISVSYGVDLKITPFNTSQCRHDSSMHRDTCHAIRIVIQFASIAILKKPKKKQCT